MKGQIVGTAFSTLSTSELLTLAIATYAAVISTFVLGWDAYKWLAAGARIEVSASGNMQLIGGGHVRDGSLHIVVTATNAGDRPTTITNLGGMYFESWWGAYVRRRKATKAFIVGTPSEVQRIPYRFEVGDQWTGLADQTKEVEDMARNGYLFLILYTTGKGPGHRVRLKIKPPPEGADQ